ncbi:uncharacterized protein [Danio rerio]|uniref:Uncharacterized protein n=1 Tax=Danio rerio TaxID=7955 RepID=A0AC58HJC4_DANRE
MLTLLGVIALVLRGRTVNEPHPDREEPVEKNSPPTMTSDGREIDGRTEHLSSEEPSTSGCPVHVDDHSDVLHSPITAPIFQTPDHAAAQSVDDIPTACATSDCSEDDVLQAAVPLLADLCARVLQDTEPQSCQQQHLEKTVTGREIDGRAEHLSSEELSTSGCPVCVDNHSDVLHSPITAPIFQTPDHAAAQSVDDIPTACATSDCSEDDVLQAAVPLLADLCARVLRDTEPQSCQQQDMEKTVTGREIDGRTEHLSLEEPSTSGCPVYVDNHSDVLHSPITAPTPQTPDHAAAQSVDDIPTACATSDCSEDDVLQAAVPLLADLCARVLRDTEPQSCQQQDMEKTVTGREINGRTEHLSLEELSTSGCPVYVDNHSDVLHSPITAPTLQTPDHAAAQSVDDIPTACATSDCSEDDVLQAAVPLLADLCARVLQDTEPQSCQQQDMEKTVTGREIDGRTEHLSSEEPSTSGCPVHVDDHSDVLQSPSTAPTLQTSDRAAAQSIDNVPTACATSDCNEDDVLQAAVPSFPQEKKTIFVINSRQYEVDDELGEGGFGTVYAATRLDDGLQVAVKYCMMYNTKFISIDGFAQPLPIEIALQILANRGPRVPEIIELLDWQVERDFYLMVLERPIPCQPLIEFVKSCVGPIKEDGIRFIMKQVVSAAQTCCQRKVLHRDIKLENLLIKPDTLEVKLIDFGCGEILKDEAYTAYCGTKEYCPPEVLVTGKYHGEPATVWSLGIVLFLLIFWKFPTMEGLNTMMDKDWVIEGMSEECTNFMRWCLKIDPRERIKLERLNLHSWFMTNEEKKSSEIMVINSSSYELGVLLGRGGFGLVQAATRLEDGLQVAIKFANTKNVKFIDIDGYPESLPMEVALSILANQEPAIPEIIKLLDWRVDEEEYIMVLERPMPAEELSTFLMCQESFIDEDLARVIMRQATLAAQTCCRRKVFHRDIKMENFLINPDTLEVKLIDFGCGEILTDAPYRGFAGTNEYIPPEYLMTGEYHGEPTTVWSLGVLLYAMMCGEFPNRHDLQMIRYNIWTKDHLTKECCDLIRCCLQIDPAQRIELEKLSLHDWFMTEDVERLGPEDWLVHQLSEDFQLYYVPFFLIVTFFFFLYIILLL